MMMVQWLAVRMRSQGQQDGRRIKYSRLKEDENTGRSPSETYSFPASSNFPNLLTILIFALLSRDDRFELLIAVRAKGRKDVDVEARHETMRRVEITRAGKETKKKLGSLRSRFGGARDGRTRTRRGREEKRGRRGERERRD